MINYDWVFLHKTWHKNWTAKLEQWMSLHSMLEKTLTLQSPMSRPEAFLADLVYKERSLCGKLEILAAEKKHECRFGWRKPIPFSCVCIFLTFFSCFALSGRLLILLSNPPIVSSWMKLAITWTKNGTLLCEYFCFPARLLLVLKPHVTYTGFFLCDQCGSSR